MRFLFVRQSSVTSTVSFPFFVLLLLCTTKALENETIPALIAFGDSILDTGNNNHLKTLSKCNFPPYGRDFIGGRPTGRWCNGKIITDLMAEALKIKEVVPAYLDPNLQNNDLPTGVSFASGGSGLDILTARIQMSILSMSDQVNLFKQYIGKLSAVVGEERSKTIISNALILVSAGNNDIAITFFTTRLRAAYGFPTYSTMLVGWTSTFLKELYELGARRFAVLSTLPLGCLPGARSLRETQRLCNEFVNAAAQTFNAKLSAELKSLSSSLPGSKMTFVDVYTPLLDLINNPAGSGFTVASKGCFQLGSFICPDASKYVFWDFAHPTERADKIMVSEIIQTYGNNF